ncbi:hypothetical protein CEP10_15300 [Cylindrospermopsis raciborskii S07]|uniref:Polyketide biosynthesis operon protein CyrO n=1 Tax=Cylindrospermopsis raciborskii CS-505 TaxID=533240 RepID=A0A853MJ28_9CYAN|nr:hypothetical protein [Cylindrospermopsis raciborskii]EFA68816.1 hypothetical protein CRC_02680 [Cylindrospermopsis raciborskii CS-505]OBU77256.1 polyketide biosynthesis operon protein CyrO [Cylindrospermopsis raciborskii CS-505]PNK02141.1 hypothetical protein CEP12_17490 [Cylindrospermopsis raciborskii S14]PNK03376.1 hypothetical protein CEP10_15300 [Cylindrospermopsis raciborskii S07]PNK03828.1 hypothetical protein CEP11_12450 [Cylindrospermopsis raciborskii S10]
MPKQFNTAGPCKANIHYMLSPTGRLPQLKALIDGENYFIIHAPRQVGKTTAMMALAQELTDSGQYLAMLLTVETGAPFPDAPEQAQQSILRRWQNEIRFRKLPLPTLTQIQRETETSPRLVNALARQATQVLVQDVNEPITAEVINQAKEMLIQRQDTHLDSLAERLREERVKTIIEPILAGEDLPDVPPDDIRYVLDLGLCRDQGQGLEIANPIYKEVLPLVLSYTTRVSIGAIEPLRLNEQGELLPDKLLHAFLEFWRQHGEPLLKSAPYHEIAPHLVLMAFLHRVVNGGGTLEREYAIGSGRMDICLRYGKVVMGMELKVWRERKSDPLIKGLTQLDKYLDGLGLDTGWLVIFDRRPGLPPMGERISTEEVISPNGRTITLIRS